MPEGRFEDQLGDLLAVTDIGLTRLDVDDLLAEMLDRLRTILAADTAVVLLREQGSDDLVARAAVSLELEVRQGVRVPIGTGFAGTIAARKEPIRLEHVDATTVANPLLWEMGVQRLLGVPLLVGDTVIGVLHLGRKRAESFTDRDTQLLQVAAERFATAIQTRRFAVEAAAAASLERGLLPTRLPRLPGLQFAARYAPAEDRSIGGDWYDCFVLPSGRLWVVIGDVAGHGLNSAVAMSRVKSALRAYALLGGGPAPVLELTNRKLSHFEIGTMVTITCAVASPPYDRFEISSAGHPPPVRVAPGAEAELLPVRPGPPIGTMPDATYAAEEFELDPGAALLLYTDGLVERRGEAIDVGLDRLRAAVQADHPETMCHQVMHDLVGDTATVDDVAVLAVRRVPGPEATAAAGTGAHDPARHLHRDRDRDRGRPVAPARAPAVGRTSPGAPCRRPTPSPAKIATTSTLTMSAFHQQRGARAQRLHRRGVPLAGAGARRRHRPRRRQCRRAPGGPRRHPRAWHVPGGPTGADLGVRAPITGPGKAVWFTVPTDPVDVGEPPLDTAVSGSGSG